MSFLFDLGFHLKFAGWTLMFLGIAHAFFERRFGWREELSRVSLLTRQIFYVHTFFVALVVFLMGALCVFGTRGLLEPTFLARALTGALCVFWLARLFCQFFVYSRDLWRGKPFETAMHALFALGWTYYSAVFGWAFWQQLNR